MHEGKIAGRLGSLFLLASLGACAVSPAGEEAVPALRELPPRQELAQVAFFPQRRYQCGPAALATVLHWGGKAIGPDELVGQIYTPGLQGSLQVEILAASRRHGQLPYRIPASLDALLRELAAGNPVLVLQNLGLSWAPRWHYAVAIGYDLPNGEVILRSGSEARHRTTLSAFRRSWADGGNWAIVVLPPHRLPATAVAEDYLQAVLELERLGQWSAARQAYLAALSRWPGNLVALMGRGNMAYRLGDLAGAEQAFRQALRQHPDAAAAHNNLANTLLALGKPAEAEQHARRAIQLGGKGMESYHDTLTRISHARQASRQLQLPAAETETHAPPHH